MFVAAPKTLRTGIKRTLIAWVLTLASSMPARANSSCGDLKEIAQEAVAISMLGIDLQRSTPACAAQARFRNFESPAGMPDGDFSAPPRDQVIRFNPTSDRWNISAIEKQDDAYVIQVRARVAGRDVISSVIFTPDANLQRAGKGCGIVIPQNPRLVRTDCLPPR